MQDGWDVWFQEGEGIGDNFASESQLSSKQGRCVPCPIPTLVAGGKLES